MMRRLLASAARTRAATAAVATLERLLPDSATRLSVITYHRVGSYVPGQPRYPGLISATTEDFARHMEFVARNRRALSGDELLAIAAGADDLPRRATVVTFDDAYRDFAEEALPVLRRVGIPAVLFVPTAFPSAPERGFWWDRLYAALDRAPLPARLRLAGATMTIDDQRGVEPAFRALAARIKGMPHVDAMTLLDEGLAQLPDPGPCHDVMDWDEIRSLTAHGITVGPHSRTHPRLDHLDADALRDEVTGSRADLERELGTAAAPIFAYPDGGHDANVVQATRDAGLTVAFTTDRGTNDVRALDWLRIRRINVGPRSSLPLIRAQLLTGRETRPTQQAAQR